jgi:hypothetical protein
MASDNAAMPTAPPDDESRRRNTRRIWRRFLGSSTRPESESDEDMKWGNREKWTLGVMSDKHTDEVPGISNTCPERHLMRTD